MQFKYILCLQFYMSIYNSKIKKINEIGIDLLRETIVKEKGKGF